MIYFLESLDFEIVKAGFAVMWSNSWISSASLPGSSKVSRQMQHKHVYKPAEFLNCFSFKISQIHLMPWSLDLNPVPSGLYLWKKPIGEGNGSEGQEKKDIIPCFVCKGSRPSPGTSGWGQSHEEIRDVASCVVPHLVERTANAKSLK